MKGGLAIATRICLVCLLLSCSGRLPEIPAENTGETLGKVTLDLDANKPVIRTKEALIGNMLADALKEYAFSKGYEVDFALINSGSIRFDEENRPDGIYPAGLYTKATISELLPFGNEAVIVTITGEELKSVMERSVAELPEAKGGFLQVSEGVEIVVDDLQQAQLIETDAPGDRISVEGLRIVSIKINGLENNPLAEYRCLVPDYIAEGGDYYITFADIPDEKKYI